MVNKALIRRRGPQRPLQPCDAAARPTRARIALVHQQSTREFTGPLFMHSAHAAAGAALDMGPGRNRKVGNRKAAQHARIALEALRRRIAPTNFKAK
jgi:hypothetical protein